MLLIRIAINRGVLVDRGITDHDKEIARIVRLRMALLPSAQKYSFAGKMAPALKKLSTIRVADTEPATVLTKKEMPRQPPTSLSSGR